MKAVQCVAYGRPRDLVLSDLPEPKAKPDQLVIATEAVGLGFVDALHVQGGYQIKKPLPFIPGSEIAGHVIAVGEGVDQSWIGKRVLALSPAGALAERVALPVEACTILPQKFSSVAAASSLVNYCTGLYGFQDCGALQAGETVLILGASGGVGMAAIDIAKGLGATVIAAASNSDKLAACIAQGADLAIDYSQADWRKTLEGKLNGAPVNLVYDPVGGNWSETAFRCLSPRGRHLVVGFAGGAIPRIPLNLPLLKRASIVGVDWGGYVRADERNAKELRDRLVRLVENGTINPQPGATFPLSQASDVLERLLNRESIGKPVITFAQ